MIIFALPGYSRNLGHRDALQSWSDRDEDTVKAPAQGVGPLLAATHCEAGESRDIPQAGKPRAEPGRMGGKRGAGLAQRTVFALRA